MADPLARFVGVGDYTDGVSPSNGRELRASFERGLLYDTVQEMLIDASRQQVQTFLDIVKPTRGRWDFLVEGHHRYRYVQDKQVRTSDQDIADFLGCPNLGDGGAIVSYQFKNHPSPLRMFVRHGESRGASGSMSASLNQLEKQMRAFTCHIYLTGHFHTLVAARAVKLHPDADDHLAATDAVMVCGGSWMQSYVPNKTSYAEAGMMVPLAIGAPLITATKRKGGSFSVRVTL